MDHVSRWLSQYGGWISGGLLLVGGVCWLLQRQPEARLWTVFATVVVLGLFRGWVAFQAQEAGKRLYHLVMAGLCCSLAIGLVIGMLQGEH
jgi:hypothetical protein